MTGQSLPAIPSTDALAPAGRVIMLSGASRGIGLSIAQRLYEQGYTLSLGVRKMEEARMTYAGFDLDRLLLHAYDAVDPDAATPWISATVARFGRLDALINNAGILRPLSLTEGDEKYLDEMWAVNVKGPFRLIREAFPHLKQAANGRIVNIASTDGKRFRDPITLGYSMTKHALMALSHAARAEGWDAGVRVTAICPGAVDTEMIASLPGASPAANRLAPGTISDIVAFLLQLPKNAVIAELVVNTRLESSL